MITRLLWLLLIVQLLIIALPCAFILVFCDNVLAGLRDLHRI